MEEIQPAPQPIEQTSGRSNKLRIIIAVVVLVMILSLLGFLVSQRMTKTEVTKSQNPENLIAEVAGQKLYREDVIKFAQTYSPTSEVNQTLLADYLNVMIERKILDFEVKKLNLNITDLEVDSILSQTKTASEGAISNTQPIYPEIMRDNIKYSVIREKITSEVVSSRKAYTLGFWAAPFDTTIDLTPQQKKEADMIRVDGKKALTEALSSLKGGDVFHIAARAIYTNYPSLRKVVAVNGYLYEQSRDSSIMVTPKLYILNERELEKPLLDALTTSGTGELVLIWMEDGSGGFIVQPVSDQKGQYENYESWLDAKKQEMLKIYRSI